LAGGKWRSARKKAREQGQRRVQEGERGKVEKRGSVDTIPERVSEKGTKFEEKEQGKGEKETLVVVSLSEGGGEKVRERAYLGRRVSRSNNPPPRR